MKLSVRSESWPTVEPFRIAGKTFHAFDVVVVQLAADGYVGQGEGMGVFYLGDDVDGAVGQIEAIRPSIESGISREQLRERMPPSSARNAVDAALWDLEAKSSGRRVWDLCSVTPRDLETQFTIGIEPTPDAMADRARTMASHRYLKIKVDSERTLERVRAVRAARPDARLVVDANQAWTLDMLQAWAPELSTLGVVMIEQPLPHGEDAELENYISPVPLCADESCQHIGDLDIVSTRYQLINIKLDKTGGLTAGLELARAAHERGLRVMVGCMGGTSLSMAPAFVLACASDITDLDGPLWQRSDRLPGIAYEGGRMPVFGAEVWG